MAKLVEKVDDSEDILVEFNHLLVLEDPVRLRSLKALFSRIKLM